MNPAVVEVTRNDFVEAVHRGRVVALDAGGATALSIGAIEDPVLLRSAAKPLQAVGMVRADGVNAVYYRTQGTSGSLAGHVRELSLGPLRFSGYFAWLFWLFAHIYFLIGFRNRLVVLLDWGSAYWSFQRSARVVADVKGDQEA